MYSTDTEWKKKRFRQFARLSLRFQLYRYTFYFRVIAQGENAKSRTKIKFPHHERFWSNVGTQTWRKKKFNRE